MKNLSLLLILSFVISSCATFHSIPFFLESPAIENNFKYVRGIVGKSQATYIFGIGGLQREGLAREAKNNLLNNNTIEDGQILVNYTIDKETSYYFGFVVTLKIIVSADVIEYDSSELKADRENQKKSIIKNNLSAETKKRVEERKRQLQELLRTHSISQQEYDDAIKDLEQLKQ
jgi:hypothetical protein